MITILLFILLIIIALLIVINICLNTITMKNINKIPDLKNNYIKGGMVIVPYVNLDDDEPDTINAIYCKFIDDTSDEHYPQLVIEPYIMRIDNYAFARLGGNPRNVGPMVYFIKFEDRKYNQPTLDIGNNAFEGNNIKDMLIIPSFIRNIEYEAFKDNDEVTSIICIDGYKKIEDGNVLTIYDNAFEGCDIQFAILPQKFDNDEELLRIGIDLSNIEKVILWGSKEYNNHPIIKDETFKRRSDFAAFTSGLNSIPKDEISIMDDNTQSAIVRQKNRIASFL